MSTNFTTSAAFLFAPGSHEEWLAGQPRILVEGDHSNYFCGIAAAPEAPTGALAGVDAAVAGDTTTPLAGPGIASAPDAGASGADAVGRSRTLPVLARGRSFALYAR